MKKMEKVNIGFGEYLTLLREKRGTTLQELAGHVRVSELFLSDVERTRRAPFTAVQLERAAAALQLSEEEKTKLVKLAGEAWHRHMPIGG